MPQKVNQIKLRDTQELADIEAKSLEPTQDYIGHAFLVRTTGESAMIKFNYDQPQGQDPVGGLIEFNVKGNLAIESLTKHVNIEAKKGIQLKPTTNIIFDSSRRVFNNKGNEVHLQFVFDDYDSATAGQHPGDDEEYAELKIEARNIDLRCFDHGGVAIQPCGKDGNNFENKIKFESSRTSAINVAATYSAEGGKGLEFGTFNNLHTSLFTTDYRFNKDGIVYAVTRQTPVKDAKGKFDYPTQADDFKDVINSDLGVTWEVLVKTAKVFGIVAESGSTVDASTIAGLLATAYNQVF